MRSKGSPRLIKSGKLEANCSFKSVLEKIAVGDSVELGILHIRGSVLRGDVVIDSGRYILGASTNYGLSGWLAARALLNLTDAIYQFHDFSQADIGSLDQGLSIKLQRVIDAMPDLPEKLEELNPRHSLNRIRAVDIDGLQKRQAADQAVVKYLSSEVSKFEEKSMRWRAVILWGVFAFITLATLLAQLLTRRAG